VKEYHAQDSLVGINAIPIFRELGYRQAVYLHYTERRKTQTDKSKIDELAA
jgi:hypothetical protein